MEPISYAQVFAEQWQRVTVTFLANNQYQRVEHSLTPRDPRDVRYLPIRQNGAGDVYDNLDDPDSQPTHPWASGSIVLACSVAVTVELILFVPRQSAL